MLQIKTVILHVLSWYYTAACEKLSTFSVYNLWMSTFCWRNLYDLCVKNRSQDLIHTIWYKYHTKILNENRKNLFLTTLCSFMSMKKQAKVKNMVLQFMLNDCKRDVYLPVHGYSKSHIWSLYGRNQVLRCYSYK